MALHLVLADTLAPPIWVVRLQPIGDLDVKIPFVLRIRFVFQDAFYLFSLFDSEDISQVEHCLLPVGVFGMRAGRESYWFVARGEVDVKPSYEGMNEVVPSDVESEGGSES